MQLEINSTTTPILAVESTAVPRDVALDVVGFTLEVLGVVASKGSARPMLNRKTGKAFTFAGGSKVAEAKIKNWDANVRGAALALLGERDAPVFVDTALSVGIVFRMARPAYHWGKGKRAGMLAPSAPSVPRGKPDIDKLARSTLDALTGLAFDDDGRVARLVLTKVWAAPGREGATIRVEAMP